MAENVPNSFLDLAASLKAVIAASYKLAPAAVLVMIGIIAAVIGISIQSSSLMMGVVLIVVWVVSLLVYVDTKNFGQAALAMVAGLITAYSVQWTPMRFAAFVVAWVGLAGAALIISSIRIAAESEQIYMDGATFTAPDASQIKSVYQRLRNIGEKTQYGSIGPIQRAAIVRFFCFRRVPIDLMRHLLQATETISLASRLEPLRIAALLADFTRLHTQDLGHYEAIIEALDAMDTVDAILKHAGVSPDEYITAIEDSRHVFLGRRIPVHRYFNLLGKGLNAGVAPRDMGAWLEGRTEENGDV